MSFHFDYVMVSGTMGINTLTALCTFFATNKLDLYVLAVSDQVEVDQVKAAAVTNQDDIQGFVNLNNLEGVLVPQACPNSSAAVAKLVTDAPNAKHNGRLYLPGCPEENQTSGVMTAGQTTLFNTFTTALVLDIQLTTPEDGLFRPIVINRVVDGVPLEVPIGYDIQSATVGSTLYQQRRRGGKRFGLSG